MTGNPWRYLSAREVGVLFGQERAKQRGEDPETATPISTTTVWTYVSHSRIEGGRYKDFPMPMPEYPNPKLPLAGQHSQWYPAEGETIEDLKRRLREWWNNRPTVHTPSPAGERRAEVAALVRARAAAGHRDQDIADELNAKYGGTPRGLPYTDRAVSGIRQRNGIDGGAFYRSHWRGAPSSGAAEAS